MSAKRAFMIFHTHGQTCEWAETAEKALKDAFLPRGFKDAMCVIDFAFVSRIGPLKRGQPFAGVIGHSIPETKGAA